MSDGSPIEWCSATWNFLIGCTKKSAGCMRCYAIRQAWRLMHNPNPKIAKKFEGTVARDSKGELNWTGRVNFDDELIFKPLSWRLPRRVFVNSLSDLFHVNVKDEWIDQAFAVMALCPQHVFQILTKEPERMAEYLKGTAFADRVYEAARKIGSIDQLVSLANLLHGPSPIHALPNVWLGVSCEDQKTADERMPFLLGTPAAVRWVSAEPLLGPIEFSDVTHRSDAVRRLGKGALDDIHWVVVGGESGAGARPMHPDWARSLRDQCVAAGVPFFFKQWGEFRPLGSVFNPSDTMFPIAAGLAEERKSIAIDGGGAIYWNEGDEPPVPQTAVDAYVMSRVGKGNAGRSLDGREWSQYPDVAMGGGA